MNLRTSAVATSVSRQRAITFAGRLARCRLSFWSATDVACITPKSSAESRYCVQTRYSSSVNILTFVVGAIAVIMMIYAGFLFVTSAGDANKIATAKKAVLYAVIGVAIIAIAQIFSQFIATKIFQFP